MAKTTRPPRTEHGATLAQGMRNPSLPSAVTDSDVARRACELYEERGCEHGRDVDDWLPAENDCEMRQRPPQHDCVGRSS